MGVGSSKSSALASHDQLLARLAGTQSIDHADTFWDALFTYSVPLATLQPEDVQEALAPHCRQLREFLTVASFDTEH